MNCCDKGNSLLSITRPTAIHAVRILQVQPVIVPEQDRHVELQVVHLGGSRWQGIGIGPVNSLPSFQFDECDPAAHICEE